MTTIPTYYRMTGGLQKSLFLQTYKLNMQRLIRSELELSTGRKINYPSDDPLGTRVALGYENTLARTEQYLSTVDRARGELEYVDASLDGIGDIVNKARETYLSLIGDPADAGIRENAAVEIGELLDELVSIANSKYGNKYLFGGYETANAPFEIDEKYHVKYLGTDDETQVAIAEGQTISISLPGSKVFGALEATLVGEKLDPLPSLETKLRDLNNTADGPDGVQTGKIDITVQGFGPPQVVTVDLTEAEDLNDVVEIINQQAASIGVTAALPAGSNALRLTSGAGTTISVKSVSGYEVAEDLGIAGTSATNVLDGTDLDPALTRRTSLSDLRAGAGIDLTGIHLANGSYEADVDFTGAVTLEDVLNRINASGTQVKARIADDGQSIKISSKLSGVYLTITDIGAGTSALDLGLTLELAETPLSSLNGGSGIDAVHGDDFEIQLHSGKKFAIDISGAKTVEDVIDLINNDVDNGGDCTAVIGAGPGNYMEIIDNTAGAEDFKVERLGGSYACTNLGIEQNAGAGNTVTGNDLSPVGVMAHNLFSALVLLRDGLSNDNEQLMNMSIPILDDSYNNLLAARVEAGGRLNRLEMAYNRLEEEKIQVQSMLSSTVDADLAESTMNYQQEQMILQAALSSSGQLVTMTLLDYL